MFTIYKIINLINSHFYIGFTTEFNLETRLHGHYKSTRNGSTGLLHRAFRKYGCTNFCINILEQGENSIYGLTIAEPMYIKWLKPEYNMTNGGEGTLGWKPSKETRDKLRRAPLGKKASNETKKKMSLSQKGICKPPRTLQHNEQQRLSHLGQIPWNSGLKGTQVAWNKSMAQPKLVCPHCSKIGGAPGVYKWHFANCKEKVVEVTA